MDLRGFKPTNQGWFVVYLFILRCHGIHSMENIGNRNSETVLRKIPQCYASVTHPLISIHIYILVGGVEHVFFHIGHNNPN